MPERYLDGKHPSFVEGPGKGWSSSPPKLSNNDMEGNIARTETEVLESLASDLNLASKQIGLKRDRWMSSTKVITFKVFCSRFPMPGVKKPEVALVNDINGILTDADNVAGKKLRPKKLIMYKGRQGVNNSLPKELAMYVLWKRAIIFETQASRGQVARVVNRLNQKFNGKNRWILLSAPTGLTLEDFEIRKKDHQVTLTKKARERYQEIVNWLLKVSFDPSLNPKLSKTYRKTRERISSEDRHRDQVMSRPYSSNGKSTTDPKSSQNGYGSRVDHILECLDNEEEHLGPYGTGEGQELAEEM